MLSISTFDKRDEVTAMRIPRDLSGHHLSEVLCKHWGYYRVHQTGSHIILNTELPFHQRIPVPNHNPVRLGTLRDVSLHKGVSRDDIIRTL